MIKLFQSEKNTLYEFQKVCSKPNYLLRSEPDYISNHILKDGHWEKDLIDFAKTYLKPESIVIDIGANIGCWSIELSQFCPKGGVYCFEPQLETFKQLCGNLFINGCCNVIPYNVALGTKEQSGQMLTMRINSHNNGGSYVTDQPAEDNGVLLKCLDDYNFPKISLIKVDVEGFELNVFQGGEEFILRDKPVIFFEAWSTHQKNLKNIVTWLENKGYIVMHYDNDDYYAYPKVL